MSRQIGALWVRVMKDGKKYMTGTLNDLSGDIRIAVFPNNRKEKENQPDFQIVLSGEKKEGNDSKPVDIFDMTNLDGINQENPKKGEEDFSDLEIDLGKL